MPRETRTVEAAGARLHVCESGAGEPLLLIMGIGGHVEMWRGFEDALHPAGIRTIAFDAPGTGQSTAYRRPRRMSGLARTVESMLDALGYDQVDVLGVSFGGGLAQQLAHQAPERVRRLVLCATSAGMVALPGDLRAMTALATPRRYWDRAYYGRVAPRIFGGDARRLQDPAQDAGARFLHPPSTMGYSHQLMAMAGWTSFHWLSGLSHPTLVMTGDDDPLVPVVNAQLLAWRIPNAELHVVKGGGHLFLLERPLEAAAIVSRFLSEATP
jgi:poly(3-hydroxyalkanoate) depolymerase